MKKIFIFISLLVISCSDSSGNIEGIISDIKKGDDIGEFIYIEIQTDDGEKEKLYASGKNFGHYTYDHLISHQLSNDILEINYVFDSEIKVIKSISKHEHSH
tara:strand:+ start:286 stop:591 length:306 start_codon:yes stop_codon:yes gene_type:complete